MLVYANPDEITLETLVITHFVSQVPAVMKCVRLPAGKDVKLKELARTVQVLMIKLLAINALESYNQGPG